MDSSPLVFDISSDEECGGETVRGANTAACGGGGGYEWLAEFLERESEDSDGVELLGEVFLNPKPRPKSSSVSEKARDFDDDDDDECVILDGDPDKPDVIEKDNASDSDDLLIVGEKGQIACRDYPHSRHLCAKFPFASTPHHNHCHLCHCYVCDSPAPCVKWGNATSSIDHCHATDKHEYWKLQRRNLKQGENAPPPVLKLPIRSAVRGPPQTIPVPQLPPPPLVPPPPLPLALPPPSLAPAQPPPPSLPQYVSHHQVYRPTTIRPCSTSTIPSITNTTNQGRIRQPPFVNSRHKFHPHLVSRRDRSHSVGNLGPQFTNSHALFKRPGMAGGASTTHRSGFTSSNNNNATQYFRNSSNPAASEDRYYNIRRELPSGMSEDRYYNIRPRLSNGMSSDANACRAPFFPNSGSFGNAVASHNRVSPLPNRQGVSSVSVPSQPLVSSDLNTVPYPQASPEPNTGSNFECSVPSQPTLGSDFEYSAPSPKISQPNVGNTNFECSVPSQPTLESDFVYSPPSPKYSQPNTGNTNFKCSVPSQPTLESDFAYSPPSPAYSPLSPKYSRPNTGNTNFKCSVPSQPTLESDFAYSPRSPAYSPPSPKISRPNMGSSFMSPELSQHQVYSQSIPVLNDEHNGPQYPLDEFSDFNLTWDNPTGETNQQPFVDDPLVHSAGASEFAPQIPASINVGSPDFHYDSWMLANQPVSGSLDVPLPSGSDVYSPESAHLDSSFLFDL